MKDLKILAIDCSSVSSSVAVAQDSKRISEMFVNVKLKHSKTLLPMAHSALSAAGMSLSDIDAFAVTTGPGSFTGLRIGVAAVLGMAFEDNKPCYPVSSLEAAAYGLKGFDGTVCAVMDARCGQFYNAMFKVSPSGEVKRLCPDRALAAESIYSELEAQKGPIIVTGDGGELFLKGFENKDKLNISLAPEHLRHPSGFCVAIAALESGVSPVSGDKLVPVYLRLPQAERERLARLGKEVSE